MPLTESEVFNRVLIELSRLGLLLESDSTLPSVAGLVAGEPVRGSWWSHPRSHAIFRISERLVEHPDVLFVKLILGKVTLVHRRLWPAIVAVASSRERWQVRGLSNHAATILRIADRSGRITAQEIREALKVDSKTAGDGIRELERLLLIHSESVHTDKGAHQKVVTNWNCWLEVSGATVKTVSPVEGKSILEAAARSLGGERAAHSLPWVNKHDRRSR
ncbi:MAG TPA: hypothetical protein VFV34_17795 [Blastocatellia bacterium]|nr:hypothetical protein [Blastocatellia bacterium]